MTSEVICAADPTRQHETEKERIDRLMNEQKKTKLKREMLENELYG